MSIEIEGELRKYVGQIQQKPEVLTFSDYLEKVKKNPRLASTAHKRIFDMISSYGVEVDGETGVEKYRFFETELFGIEDSTKEIMEYFKGAALGAEVGKRFLLMFGPPASGKSCLLTMVKRGMEEWSKTEQGAMYAIEGCPMNEDPLNAVPAPMRPKVEKDLGIKIEGTLCPVCAYKLREDFEGDFLKFSAKRFFMSEAERKAIGSFCPSDPKSQDISELIGGIDLSKVGNYGSESHPLAFKFDGELNVANRGLVDFIEILKLDEKFLYVLLTATQEHVIKTPRYPLIHIDEVIMSHTNESEYTDFMGNPKNEALIDRMIVCEVKYNLHVDDEVRIYEKLFRQGDTGDIHIAPHTFKVAAIFAVLTRLEEPKDRGLDVVKKMKLYNGEDVEGFSKRDIPRLKRDTPREGMAGMSPRFVIDRLVTTAIRAPEGVLEDGKPKPKYVTPIEALRALKDGLGASSKFKPEERERFNGFLQLAKVEFDGIARNEVQKAFFVSFEEEAETMVDNYIDNIEAFLEKTTVEDPVTKEEIPPDEKLMRSIETKIGISEDSKETFRNEIIRKVAAATRAGQKFRYQDHARLREAIEKELFEDKRDVIKMTISSRTKKDPKQLKRINDVVRTLCDEHGYIAESANDLLKYVSSMMSREK
jgi:serine protein kinase